MGYRSRFDHTGGDGTGAFTNILFFITWLVTLVGSFVFTIFICYAIWHFITKYW